MYDGTLKFDTSLDSSGFQKDANKLGDIVRGLSVFELIKKGLEMVASSIDGAVSRYDTLNQFPKIMEQMGYGAEEGGKAIQKLSGGIQGLPTTLDGIVSSTKQLVITTGSLETGVDTALALNNAFLASGASAEDAGRGAIQYTQMLSSGKVDMQSWRTLQETMAYALNETAKAFGFTGNAAHKDLYAALKAGDITFDQFNSKIIELNKGINGFAEVAQTATGGIGTAMTNLGTRTVLGVTTMIEAFDRGLSKTRFQSIENTINTTSTNIKNALVAVAPVAELVASNLDILSIAAVSVTTAFAAYSIIGTTTTAFKAFQTTISAAKGMLELSTAVVMKDAAAHTMLVAALASETTAEAVRTAAKKAGMTIDAAGNLITVQGTAATTAETIAVLSNSGALTAKTVVVGLLTGSISLATAAQWLWNAAMTANPIGLIVAGIALLVGAIIGLIALLSKGSEEYRKQKEEIKALSDTQEALSESMSDSESAFKSNTDSIEANAKVAQNLVGKLKEVSTSTDNVDDKHRRMDNTIKQLNATVDGLNLAYDRETGEITNLNTGQQMSIEQLEKLIDAKAELAKANAWQERANELVREQVKLFEDQEVILNKIDEINENSNLTQQEKRKLVAELTKTYDEYGVMAADVETRIAIVNENISNSNTSMAESVVADYERMEQAVTETGDGIEDVAAQWGVSVDEILAAMERENISLDEWVAKQQGAWEDYESSVKERTQGVINSFREIPGEYDKSAAEMLSILQNNRERYAEWETAMEEITRQLGPTAAEEFGRLGPEATSAMQEILNSAELLEEYRNVFGVKLDEVTGTAIEDWNDPNFIGAPSEAIDSSAQIVTQNTALGDAVSGQVSDAKSTMQKTVEEVDFTTVGQSIAHDIVQGVTNADLSGIAGAVANAITSGNGKVTSAANTMSASVQNVFKTMSTHSQSTTNQMMTNMNSAITSKSGTIKASATAVSNAVIASLNTMIAKAAAIATQMMTGVNSSIVSRTGMVQSSSTAVSNAITTALNPMIANGASIAAQMMAEINSGIITRTPLVKGSAAALNNGVINALDDMPAKATAVVVKMMTSMSSEITVKTPAVTGAAAATSKGVVDNLQPMVKGGTDAASQMMDGMHKAMQDKAQALYKQAREIANKISSTLRDAWDEHSPSRVSYEIMEFYMRGMYNSMEDMSGLLYRKADDIADGLTDRLTISPTMAESTVERLRAIVEANPFTINTVTPAAALAGVSGMSTKTTLVQNITTPKPLSPSEMTREGQNFLRWSKFQLP